jgi:hypothetical protein
MNVVTIPKRVAKEELVVIPRREYESLKKAAVAGTPKKKKLPAWLRASLKEVEEGKTRGPFHTAEELIADLRRPGK